VKIYLASSWRNLQQPNLVRVLRSAGLEVYDFRHPREGDNGFGWHELDENWQRWTIREYARSLNHPKAKIGFASDFGGMRWADCCVLLLPCGRSAHLEAGWFAGQGKPLHILLSQDKFEPELMYKMATSINCTVDELLVTLGVEP
jgi:nucleoside 2-deoxyribosyltransferase